MTDQPIGIVTLPGNTNYGNRLQNFALQEAIKSLGFRNVESLEGFPRRESKPLRARRLLVTAYDRRHEILGRVLGRPGTRPPRDVYECPPRRREAIQAFSDQYITSGPQRYTGARQVNAFTDRYQRFVVGSDQVWNPAFTQANPEWFLSFAKPEQRVAYAASIGVPEVPAYLRGRYRAGLRQIEKISVREHQAAETTRVLTGRKPLVVLDPTMLLKRTQWDTIAVRPPQLRPGSYIATFMLSAGDSVATGGPDLTKVHEHARSGNLDIVDLHSPSDPVLVAFGPREFIGAIRGAKLLVTDSFHASVFATIFHVPFLLVPRGKMNSRFETLLAHTGLDDRMLSHTPDIAAALSVDWIDVDHRIEEARKHSLHFLTESLI